MRKAARKRIGYVRHATQIFFFINFVVLVLGTLCYFKLGGVSISCALGGLQIILSSRTLIVGVVVSASIFIIVTVLLGRAFCSWACPIGTIIEFFEIGLAKTKFVPAFEKAGSNSFLNLIRNKLNKYMILAATIISALALRSPVYCAFCPIGTICRGLFGGGSIFVAGFEMALVPAAGALSLGEKRLWCKCLCPVGALLAVISKINPFAKPEINADKCSYCEICQKVCPEEIELTKDASLAECTKCLECYIKCPEEAIQIKLYK